MKGEQQEERIPNFIGNAVIILTAAHLGCEVEMLATAQEVWRTKRLPEAVLLLHIREKIPAAVLRQPRSAIIPAVPYHVSPVYF